MLTSTRARRIRRARANAGLVLGTLIGFFGGVYGAVAIGLLGYLVDSLRAERRLRDWLARPGSEVPEEVLPGIIAALALAYHHWNEVSSERRRARLEGLISKALSGQGSLAALFRRPGLNSVLAYVDEGGEIDEEALAGWLALEGSPAARVFLAGAAWTLEAETQGTLDWRREKEISDWLSKSGLDPEDQEGAREEYFPGWRSPWAVLGLRAGAQPEAIRQAWRSLSMRWHPDRAPEGAGSRRFLEAQEAYRSLMLDEEGPRP